MSVKDTIRAMDRHTVDSLLHVACLRLAFVRSTDAAVELKRLQEVFDGVEPYERLPHVGESEDAFWRRKALERAQEIGRLRVQLTNLRDAQEDEEMNE